MWMDSPIGPLLPALRSIADTQPPHPSHVLWLNWNGPVPRPDMAFSMENRTSDKYLPFMERSLAVRAFGVPTNKELGAMLWGEDEGRHVAYAAGVPACAAN